MEQRITVEQLQQLSLEQAQKLHGHMRVNLWNTVDFEGEMITFPNGKGTVVYQLPLLSIGQCIELLDDKQVDWLDKLTYADYDRGIYKYYDGELIDALFAAVKEVL